MSTAVVVYVLTALAFLVVVMTRLRLGGAQNSAGRFQVGRALLNVHTFCGVVGLLFWTTFLVLDKDQPFGGALGGIIGLAFLWITVIAGLLILTRWLPSHGRHAQPVVLDTWSEGPGLSVLAHVGSLIGLIVFTYAYWNSLV